MCPGPVVVDLFVGTVGYRFGFGVVFGVVFGGGGLKFGVVEVGGDVDSGVVEAGGDVDRGGGVISRICGLPRGLIWPCCFEDASLWFGLDRLQPMFAL